MRPTVRCQILLAAIFLLHGSVLAGPEIRCFVLQPPEKLLPGIQRVAVLDFTGSHGRTLADYLITAMLESRRGIQPIGHGPFSKETEGITYLSGAHTNVFTVIEHGRPDQEMREQSPMRVGSLDPEQAVTLGRSLGVDALVIVTSAPSANDESSREERIRLLTNETVMVDCLTRKVSVSARMRIVSASTGETLGTKGSEKNLEDKKCGPDELTELASKDALTTSCLQSIAQQDFADYLCPKFVMSEFELSDIAADVYEEEGKKAGDEAEAGNIDKAYVGYASIAKRDPYNDEALFNLGVLNEVVGNFEDAIQFYQKAYSIRESDDYSEALTRCRRSSENSVTFASLGIRIAKHPFDTSESQPVRKIKLIGDSSDRIVIHVAPQESGPAVAKVPGGIEIEMLEDNGDWFKVKTYDGKEGFVNKSDVKK